MENKPQTARDWRFDPVDIQQMRLLASIPPQRRTGAMLAAQELVRGLIMGRLRRQHPQATHRELALKLIQEVNRAGRRRT